MLSVIGSEAAFKYVDYGNETCDNMATLTVEGKVTTITL
jgi:hypothetical protein